MHQFLLIMENICLNPSFRFHLTNNSFFLHLFSLFCCHTGHQAKDEEEMVSYYCIVSLGQVHELK